MTVYFMLSNDVVFKPRLLYDLLLRSPHRVVGVTEVTHKPKRRKGGKATQGALSFWGFKGAAFLALIILGKKATSALPFPHFLRCRSTVKRVAGHFGVPYQQAADVNRQDYVEQLRLLAPDVIVSFQHQILKPAVLTLPSIACVNCHPAKLPLYRGVKPVFWAMLAGDREIGVTVHSMTPEIDAGRIICQRTFPLLSTATLLDNYIKAYSLSVDVITCALQKLETRPDLSSFPGISPTEHYYGHPGPEDMARFSSRGLRVV